ncbi:hypothetical protein LIA77_04206 [Sarocladium implicatum]|nr:hypothetical protein LIA77_04206 [Sarocladium implicatum]
MMSCDHIETLILMTWVLLSGRHKTTVQHTRQLLGQCIILVGPLGIFHLAAGSDVQYKMSRSQQAGSDTTTTKPPASATLGCVYDDLAPLWERPGRPAEIPVIP